MGFYHWVFQGVCPDASVLLCRYVGFEVSADVNRGTTSPFVSAGFVWAVLQSVYADSPSRSQDVINSTLGLAVNDVCHFLLSKVSPIPGSQQYGVFGKFIRFIRFLAQAQKGYKRCPKFCEYYYVLLFRR